MKSGNESNRVENWFIKIWANKGTKHMLKMDLKQTLNLK